MFKRGISHIEAILSFVLFIGFVFFGLYFFTPSGNTQVIDSSLHYTLTGFYDNISTEIFSFSVKINRDLIPNNYDSIAVEFPKEVIEIPQQYKVRVETYQGTVLPSTRTGDMVYFDIQEENFVIIKFSEDFPDSQAASKTPAWDYTFYNIASSSVKTFVSEKKISEFNTSYYSDYSALKDELNIPAAVTFGYQARMEDYDYVGPMDVPIGVDVYSTISRKEILKKNGKMAFGELGVNIW